MASTTLLQYAEKYFKEPLKKAHPLTQGSLSEVYHITTQNNQEYVIKNGYSPQAEAHMLQTLKSHTINVPEVIYSDQHILILEFIHETNCLSKKVWENLAQTLNILHSVHSPFYGWSEDYAFGQLAFTNKHDQNWPEFWSRNRLEPFISKLPGSLTPSIETLMKTITEFLPEHPLPSLLHGDLWTGNILAHFNTPYLIDPACYYGHNEVDLAMLNLFGSPPDAFYTHYAMLDKEWHHRCAIYQLFPAMVHYVLFGNFYLKMIHSLLQSLKL
ncbi:putative ketoamine kinase [Commensalibacter sp. Nvir]|uniref:fructosamine kinase family protein n=1 Tax=Commensalibacter sp. Nvir TaxID=3069817 RepID=UPI002D43CA5E|nr:putative ketoamine kinase [Commensalibacter sp. Nvir]